jgi:hypothetical protein
MHESNTARMQHAGNLSGCREHDYLSFLLHEQGDFPGRFFAPSLGNGLNDQADLTENVSHNLCICNFLIAKRSWHAISVTEV